MTPLWTAAEVAELMGVHVGTVWGWVRAGRIQVIRTPGNRMRFSDKALRDARNRGPDGHTGGDAPASSPDRPVTAP